MDSSALDSDLGGVDAHRPSGTFDDTAALNDAYDLVTARVLAALDRGTMPWKRPWQDLSGAPANAVTRRAPTEA